MSRWKKKNPNKKLLYLRKWMKSPKGKQYKKRSAEYSRQWRKRNPDKVKATQQRSYDKIRIECFTHYGGVICKCCGETELKFLHLDHINSDGAEQRRIWEKTHSTVFGGTGFYYSLKKKNWPRGLQVLCANCNLGKRTNKYCPHELKRGVGMNGNKIN